MERQLAEHDKVQDERVQVISTWRNFNRRKLAMMLFAAGMSILIAGVLAVFESPTVYAGDSLDDPHAGLDADAYAAAEAAAEAVGGNGFHTELFDTEASQAIPVVAQDGDLSQIEPTGNNSFCVLCHNTTTEATFSLLDGDPISIAVDPQVIADSVHGTSNPNGALGCADCHGADYFPHDPIAEQTTRVYDTVNSLICTECHTDQLENLATDVHYTAIEDGNLRAANCIDCHGAHDVQPPDEPRARISTTCGDCHKIIFDEYRTSVHGEALFFGDPNVPTCVDCHGVHGIQHPTTAQFRNRSPELCADCHANEFIMGQYNISTNVFNSYLSDFHGTTVSLFEQTDPNVPTNKAVCYDCHGVHDILSSDDPFASLQIRENLLVTCQKCHPGATADFPESWVGHFPPTLESHPLVFLVDVFYKLIIPATLGAFVFLVATDIFARIRLMFGRGKKES